MQKVLKIAIILGMRKYIFAVLVLSAAIFLYAYAQEDGGVNKAGGPCEYDQYNGTCEIVSVVKNATDGYDVRFNFVVARQIILSEEKNKLFEAMYGEGKDIPFTLYNSRNPGFKFIEKYKLKEGAVINCTFNIIKTGTCTPVEFEFQGIDRADYCDSPR